MKMINPSELQTQFRQRFGDTPRIFRAPGRVNLIGEHTDYNDGFVLPAAINYSCWAAMATREDRVLSIYSEHFNQCMELDLDDFPKSSGKWTDYPFGVAWAFAEDGINPGGANIYIASEVPLGSGLSSSAALEVSVGYALLRTYNLNLDRTQLALACQKAENEFSGAHVGIMDQFVSCHGETDHALMLDCRSLEHTALPIPPGLRLVICNTMVKHALGSSEYNTRRMECEEAVRRLAVYMPEIRALRDVSLEELNLHRHLLTAVLFRRAHHVITENDRVLKFASALAASELGALGSLMADSHRSLRDDFNVSCAELDKMVEIGTRQPGCLGARMTGGGFGGCTVNLVNAEDTAEFTARVASEYSAAVAIVPELYICRASEGANEVECKSVEEPSI